MLNELERYCPNRGEGCSWTGCGDLIKCHLKSCEFKPAAELRLIIQQQDATIALLKSRLELSESRQHALESANRSLQDRVESLSTKLRVYDAFSRTEKSDTHTHGAAGGAISQSSNELIGYHKDGSVVPLVDCAEEKAAYKTPADSSSHCK